MGLLALWIKGKSESLKNCAVAFTVCHTLKLTQLKQWQLQAFGSIYNDIAANANNLARR